LSLPIRLPVSFVSRAIVFLQLGFEGWKTKGVRKRS
jgi:hypothetical protein